MTQEEHLRIEHYSQLVGLIYDTAQTPELWPELFQSIEQYHALNDGQTISHLESHLDQALKMNNYINDLENIRDTAHQIINRLPMGIVIVDQDASIIAINHRAQQLLDKKECLHIHDHHICTQHQHTTKQLQQTIKAYANGQQHQKGMSMQVNSEKKTSIWITNFSESSDQTAKVALYIASPSIKPEYDIQSIQQDFQLTAAQAKLVALLTNGCHNLNDIAKVLHISIHTVRSQLKAVFAKTNTGCQVELVKKILTSPSAILGENQPPLPFAPQLVQGLPTPSNAIPLYDGRTLGYIEYGNPDGEPVIFLHPLIHPDKQMFHQPKLQDLIKYRIISPKRPGFLDSTPTTKDYSQQDHAKDIIQLADTLGLKKFKVIANSNGCPYAAALAHDYPQRVEKLLLISPVVPPDIDNINSNTTIYLLYQAGKYLPRKVFYKMVQVGFKSVLKSPDELITSNEKSLSIEERVFCQKTELRDYLRQWIVAAYPARIPSVCDDLLIRVRPWGFLPQDIQVSVDIWHAEDDTTVAISSVKKLTSMIPHCQTHYLKEGGHFIFFTHFDEITKDF